MNNCLLKLASILCTIAILIQLCKCLNLIDLPYQRESKPEAGLGKLKPPGQTFPNVPSKLEENRNVSKPVKFDEYKSVDVPLKPIRKYWLLNEQYSKRERAVEQPVNEEEKDTNLKQKIANLVDQTMRDTQKKMKQTEDIKGERREEPPYKVGFILCMIKKSKNVMEELFNVAVKHKDQWKSLQHLKVFELIVHTNVDTTNLLRQLVDVHLRHMNSTEKETKTSRRHFT